jgi:hypothetical protein
VTSTTSRGVRRLRVLAALVGLVAPVSVGVAADSASAAHPTASDRAPAPRYLTALVNKKEVVKGKKVTIRGAVDAPDAPACALGVTLDVERSTKGAIYKLIDHVTTDGAGAYSVRAVVNKKSRFRVSVAGTDACTEAQSPPRTVNVKTAN